MRTSDGVFWGCGSEAASLGGKHSVTFLHSSASQPGGRWAPVGGVTYQVSYTAVIYITVPYGANLQLRSSSESVEEHEELGVGKIEH